MRTVLKILIPLILAIGLLWLVLHKINVNKLLDQVSSADIGWVSLAIVISLLAHLSRAYRWNILLEPLGYKPKLQTTFAAVMVGYFGNIFLPRGGEVMRCLVLTRINKVPFNSSFGTVVAERAFDFICLLFLMAFALLLEFERFKDFFLNIVLAKNSNAENTGLLQNPIILTILVLALVMVLTAVVFRKKIMATTIFTKVKDFAFGLLKGVLSVKDSNRKGAFFLHTFLIWAGYFFMTYLMFFSLKPTSGLGLTAGLVILIVGGLGMSAPVSGGIGPFHIMVAGALELFYHISKDDGVAYAFVIHTSQLISIILVGGISSLWVLISERKSKNEPALTNA